MVAKSTCLSLVALACTHADAAPLDENVPADVLSGYAHPITSSQHDDCMSRSCGPQNFCPSSTLTHCVEGHAAFSESQIIRNDVYGGPSLVNYRDSTEVLSVQPTINTNSESGSSSTSSVETTFSTIVKSGNDISTVEPAHTLPVPHRGPGGPAHHSLHVEIVPNIKRGCHGWKELPVSERETMLPPGRSDQDVILGCNEAEMLINSGHELHFNQRLLNARNRMLKRQIFGPGSGSPFLSEQSDADLESASGDWRAGPFVIVHHRALPGGPELEADDQKQEDKRQLMIPLIWNDVASTSTTINTHTDNPTPITAAPTLDPSEAVRELAKREKAMLYTPVTNDPPNSFRYIWQIFMLPFYPKSKKPIAPPPTPTPSSSAPAVTPIIIMAPPANAGAVPTTVYLGGPPPVSSSIETKPLSLPVSTKGPNVIPLYRNGPKKHHRD
ncbi:Hypothetical protein R9X50_00372100 [Acrodontium crateriforme]|uniref:Uncharacterized protein n=1 Tax=Acrodontium crateriforme TaxID=150365 RepID=A0AAQ3M3G7_9PEZI|nr:Hypothetical protein R9X50_00372100 [Acrodontium crateriforme]